MEARKIHIFSNTRCKTVFGNGRRKKILGREQPVRIDFPPFSQIKELIMIQCLCISEKDACPDFIIIFAVFVINYRKQMKTCQGQKE